MKLYGSKMSPFVRKTLIVVEELGLGDRVGFVAAEGTPLDAPGLRAKNPLAKIPILECESGRVVYDSAVICETLLQKAPAHALLPVAGEARIDTLTRQALADGVADCAVTAAYERRLRPEAKRWDVWIDLQLGKVDRGLDAMDAEIAGAERFDLGDCAMAGVLAYLDARFADRPWRGGRPALADWFEAAKARPSVAAIL